jgi:hypothetical protein
MRSLIAALAVALALVTASGLAAADTPEESCWGQASAVFAQTGELGAHASQEATPRLGLANLAQALYDQGVLDEPTLSALGAFVAAEMGLSIEACQ